MICKNCGNQLPEGSEFCPYCMTKFNEPPVSEPIKKNKLDKNKKIIIILAAVIAVLIIVAAVLAVSLGQKNSDKESSKPSRDSESISQMSDQSKSENTNSTEESKPSSTTIPPTKATEQKAQPVNKELMIDAYINAVFEKYETALIFGLSFTYTLYDFNSDGIYEVIVSLGDQSGLNAEYCFTEVLSFKDNKVVSLGKFNNESYEAIEYYIAKDGGVIISNYGPYVAQIKVGGNKAIYNVLSYSYDDYDIYNNTVEIMPHAFDMTFRGEDTTLIEEIINKGYKAVSAQYIQDYAD